MSLHARACSFEVEVCDLKIGPAWRHMGIVGMPRKKETVPSTLRIEPLILTVRGCKGIVDADLARLYGVETRVLNQAVRRNAQKFPRDFAFRLTRQEVTNLRSQIVISSYDDNRSQFASDPTHGGRRHPSYAFTEHGALMAANVLRSERAVHMSVFVVRAFARMREMLAAQHDLARKLANLEKRLTGRLDVQETAIVDIIRELLRALKPLPEAEKPKRQIGFHAKEKRATYGRKKAQKAQEKKR